MVEEADTRGSERWKGMEKALPSHAAKIHPVRFSSRQELRPRRALPRIQEPSRSSKGAGKLPPKVRRLQEEWNTGGGLSHVGASLQHVLLRWKPEL